MLKKPSHYESTTPRLMQETLGKIVEAVNANTAARLEAEAPAKAMAEVKAKAEAKKATKPKKPKKPKKVKEKTK